MALMNATFERTRSRSSPSSPRATFVLGFSWKPAVRLGSWRCTVAPSIDPVSFPLIHGPVTETTSLSPAISSRGVSQFRDAGGNIGRMYQFRVLSRQKGLLRDSSGLSSPPPCFRRARSTRGNRNSTLRQRRGARRSDSAGRYYIRSPRIKKGATGGVTVRPYLSRRAALVRHSPPLPGNPDHQ